MSERREYLLVDGHSVIFAWASLRALHQGVRRGSAREALIKELTDYQDETGVRVVVVFDGQGSGHRAQEDSNPGGIQVFYAPAGRTADDFVERLVAKYGQTHRLTVATGDRMEQQTVVSFGAEACISPEGLRQLLDSTKADFRRRLKRSGLSGRR